MCAYLVAGGGAYQKASTTVTLTNVTSCDLKHGLHPSRLPLSLQIHRQCCTLFHRGKPGSRGFSSARCATPGAASGVCKDIVGGKRAPARISKIEVHLCQAGFNGWRKGYVASILQQGYRRRVDEYQQLKDGSHPLMKESEESRKLRDWVIKSFLGLEEWN